MTDRRRTSDGPAGGPVRGFTATALLLAFSAGILASAAGVHPCPRHHRHAPGHAAPAPADWEDAPTKTAARDDGPPGEELPGRTCTCLGDCQARVPTALHQPSVHQVVHPEAVVWVSPVRSSTVRPAARSEYFLPYPLGPPAA